MGGPHHVVLWHTVYNRKADYKNHKVSFASNAVSPMGYEVAIYEIICLFNHLVIAHMYSKMCCKQAAF